MFGGLKKVAGAAASATSNVAKAVSAKSGFGDADIKKLLTQCGYLSVEVDRAMEEDSAVFDELGHAISNKLKDLQSKRPVLNKFAYRARVLGVIKSRKSKEVAAGCMRHFKKVCLAVSKAGGAATSVA